MLVTSTPLPPTDNPGKNKTLPVDVKLAVSFFYRINCPVTDSTFQHVWKITSKRVLER